VYSKQLLGTASQVRTRDLLSKRINHKRHLPPSYGKKRDISRQGRLFLVRFIIEYSSLKDFYRSLGNNHNNNNRSFFFNLRIF
jgi:hypothetical protein